MTKTKKIVGIMLIALMLVLTMTTISRAGGIDAADMAGQLTGTESDALVVSAEQDKQAIIDSNMADDIVLKEIDQGVQEQYEEAGV